MSQKQRLIEARKAEIKFKVKEEASKFMIALLQNKPRFIPRRLWFYLLKESLNLAYPSFKLKL